MLQDRLSFLCIFLLYDMRGESDRIFTGFNCKQVATNRYLVPTVADNTSTSHPMFQFLDIRTAAATAPPLLIPQKMPSSFASRRVMVFASSSEISMVRSIRGFVKYFRQICFRPFPDTRYPGAFCRLASYDLYLLVLLLSGI